MHIYAFGSVCRGEVNEDSDVDLLALCDEGEESFSHDAYSVYSYQRINEMWEEGNPFAWHLHYESKLIFSSNSEDYLQNIGNPCRYSNYKSDFEKFSLLMNDSIKKIIGNSNSIVFELSNIFLAIRNISICYTLHNFSKPLFSRHAALMLGQKSIDIPRSTYNILERARILSTRGIGDNLTKDDVSLVILQFPKIQCWASELGLKGDDYV